MRRTPITRRTPLVSATPLRRTPIAPWVKPMRREARQLHRRVEKARKNTGPTTVQRQMVIDRALGCCEICGQQIFGQDNRPVTPYSLHHRRPRGMGGSSRADINSPANLLLLCGTGTTGCHGHVESNRATSYANGWLVRADHNPAEVPVLLEGADRYAHNDTGDRRLVNGPQDGADD